ncbi:unnamed protein product [Peniophora sp. CBMAI 1063]|nr:unnamed protein product [Peniophora sp. CBMAI 1063]
MDYNQLKSLVVGHAALPELIQAIDLQSKPRQLTSLLDLEIKRKQEALRDLQAYRNFLAAPISVLPPEILADIFYLYASNGSSNALYDLSWAKIMLVCQTWRNIGLSTPSLWSCLEFDGVSRSKRLITQLQRSKGWPLDIKARFYGSTYGSAYHALARAKLIPLESARLRSLDVYGSSNALALFLERVIPPMPTCPNLYDLKVHHTTTDVPQDGLEDGLFVLRHLVSDGVPSLSSLHLYDFAPHWQKLRGLTKLEVGGSGDGTSVSCVTLLESLSRCPSLRLLDVSLSTVGDAATRDDARVSLPSLQFLRIESQHMTTCCYLLSFLSIPPDASVNIPVTTTFDEMRLSRLPSLLRKHFKTKDARRMHTISLRARSQADGWQIIDIDIFSCVKLERLRPYLSTHPVREMPYLSISIAESTSNHLRRALAGILDAIPAQGVTHIDIAASDALSKKTWKTILSMLPALTTMMMRVDVAASLTTIDALNWYLQAKRRRPISHLLLDCLYLDTGETSEDNTRNLHIAQTAYAAAVSHASKVKALGQSMDVIEISGGRWNSSAEDVMRNVAQKHVYRLLTTGLIVDGYLYNKESTKSYYRDQRDSLRVLGIDRRDWEAIDDSEVEAELDEEETKKTVPDGSPELKGDEALDASSVLRSM